MDGWMDRQTDKDREREKTSQAGLANGHIAKRKLCTTGKRKTRKTHSTSMFDLSM